MSVVMFFVSFIILIVLFMGIGIWVVLKWVLFYKDCCDLFFKKNKEIEFDFYSFVVMN